MNKQLLLRIILSICVASVIALSYGVFKEKSNLSIVMHQYSKDVFETYKEGELLTGDKISATIFSRENNLGIIAIRFDTLGRLNDDLFTFRIKEKGNKDWYYENVYEAKKFGGFVFFPFGFPIINDSKDKYYTIELESQYGQKGNAVAIAQEEPAIVAKHKFNKAELLATKALLVPLGMSALVSIMQIKHVWYIFFGTVSFLLLPFLVKNYVKVRIVEISIKNPIKKIEYRVYKDKLRKRLGYLYELIEPLLTLVQFIVGKSFRFIVRVISYLVKGVFVFYKWLGKE